MTSIQIRLILSSKKLAPGYLTSADHKVHTQLVASQVGNGQSPRNRVSHGKVFSANVSLGVVANEVFLEYFNALNLMHLTTKC